MHVYTELHHCQGHTLVRAEIENHSGGISIGAATVDEKKRGRSSGVATGLIGGSRPPTYVQTPL